MCASISHVFELDIEIGSIAKWMLNNLMPDKRYIPGRLGFRSTVNWTATRESSFALVPNTALESPTFPTIRSWPYK